MKTVADVETDMGDLPPVRCVISDLNQVFLNLLMNAAHAIADAHPGGRGTIRVTARQDGGDAVIGVSDNGTGIRPEHQEKIFEPFFTTKEVGRGTGQGLAISRMVVEKHGGTLTFETTVGRGTTFWVRPTDQRQHIDGYGLTVTCDHPDISVPIRAGSIPRPRAAVGRKENQMATGRWLWSD